MKIKTIAATSFKGSDFEHELSPITVITGPNYAGKSSRVEAMTLALLGYLPGIDKKSNAIHEALASRPVMEVSVAFDNGAVVKRRYEKKKGVTAKTQTLELPTDWSADPVSLDAGAFFGLSANQRMKLLFGLTTVEDVYVEDVMKVTKKHVAMTAENAEPILKALSEFETDLKFAKEEHSTSQEWLENLAEQVRTKKLSCEQSLRDLEAGVTVTSSAMEFPKTDKIEKEYGEAKKALSEARDRRLNLLNDRSNIQHALSMVANSEDAKSKVESLESELKALEERLKSIPEVNVEEGKKLAAEVESLQLQIDTLSDDYNDTHSKCTSALNRVTELEEQFKNVENMERCDRCGSNHKGWQERILESLKVELKEVRSRHEMLKGKVDEKHEKIASIKKTHDEKNADLEAKRDQSRKRREIVNRVEDIKRVLPGWKKVLSEIGDETELKKKQSECEESLKSLDEQIPKLEVRLNEAEAQQDKVREMNAHTESIKKSGAKMQEYEMRIAVMKGAAKGIAELQGELIEKSIGKLVKRMNSLCSGFLRSPLAYSNGDLGYWRSIDGRKQFVSFDSMSGSEKRVTACAVTMALASKGNVRVAVFDEVLIDKQNKSKLMNLALSLVQSDKLDNVIFVDVEDNGYPVKSKEVSVLKIK